MHTGKANFAVIDLGTNTFHLLIFEKENDNIIYLFRKQIAVKLGEKGINASTIHPEAFARGMKALKEFKQLMETYQVKEVKAIATSAIRNATNATGFIEEVKNETGLSIEIIDGKKEATFIYKGVMQTLKDLDHDFVIMDIGGGSVEFIIVHGHEMKWHESFEIGAARLLELFHQADPITPEAMETLEKFLVEKLETLFVELKKYKVQKLVGSAGSFESIYDIIHHLESGSQETRFSEIKLGDYMQLHDMLIKTTLKERQQMKGLASYRAEMMVVSSCLIQAVIKHSGINHIYFSDYSLKEGVAISEFGDDKNAADPIT